MANMTDLTNAVGTLKPSTDTLTTNAADAITRGNAEINAAAGDTQPLVDQINAAKAAVDTASASLAAAFQPTAPAS